MSQPNQHEDNKESRLVKSSGQHTGRGDERKRSGCFRGGFLHDWPLAVRKLEDEDLPELRLQGWVDSGGNSTDSSSTMDQSK